MTQPSRISWFAAFTTPQKPLGYRKWEDVMYRFASRAIVLCGLVLMPVVAWCQSTLPDIDLTNNGLYLRSMQENSWVPIGPNQDVSMGRCGCLLAAAATISGFVFNLTPGVGNNNVLGAPWDINDPFLDGTFSPLYEHDFLYDPNTIIPLLADTNGWGYKQLGPGKCGVVFHPWALAREANPTILTNGGTGFTIGWSGLAWQAHQGWDFIARIIVDQNLLQGLPTVVIIDKFTSGGSFLGRHAQLIVGWNSKDQQYRIMDPIYSPGYPSVLPAGDTKETYAGWEQQIVAIMNFQPGDYGGNFIYLDLVDDPSPVRFLVIAPDGRRTGFDPVTQNFVYEVSNASYGELGAWADPLGQIPPGPPASFLSLAGAPGGTYRFEIYGTANGAATYSFDTVQLGSRTTLQNVSDVIAAGEVRKYEVQYVPAGTTTVTQVAHFTPQVLVGNAIGTTPGTGVQLDGRRSFSLEGNIVSYQWDFGDGTTGAGSQLSHTYSVPGIYSATLTVTDDQGNTASAIESVSVISPSTVPTLQLLNFANDDSIADAGCCAPPVISGDGRYVAFSFGAGAVNSLTNQTNSSVFVRDTALNTTEAIPSCCFSYPEAISGDGRFVLFYSTATNLVPNCPACANGGLYLRDRQQQTTEFVDPMSGVPSNYYSADLSSDARYVVYAGDHQNSGYPFFNNTQEIFLKDRLAAATEVIATNDDNTSPRVSPDGRFVAYVGGDGKVYLRDRQNGTTEIVSLTDAGAPVPLADFGFGSHSPSISADGRFIAFTAANNSVPSIAPNDPGYFRVFVYVRDRLNHTTRNVSVSSLGTVPIIGQSTSPALSPDGRYVVFSSNSQLVPQKQNAPVVFDIFRHDMVTGETVGITETAMQVSPASGLTGSLYPAISADGQSIAFTSNETDLVPQLQSGQPQQSNVFKAGIVASPKPVANLTGPYFSWASSSDVPTFVQLDGSQSFDPLGQALSAKWDFGDGSPVLTSTGAGQVQHSYSAPGTYNLKLVVNNGSTDSVPATTTVAVFSALHADSVVATPSCADPGTSVQISGMISSDNKATQGGWNLAQGALIPAPVQVQDFSATRTVAPSLNNFSFAFTTTVPAQASGAYQLGLAQGPTATVNVPCPTPTDVPPLANAGGPYTNGIGKSITFDGSQSSDSQNRPLTYRWSFGDGAQGTGVNPQHSYAHQGTYVVRLVVNNGVMSSTSVFGGPSFAKVAILADTIPPTTTAVLSPLPNANGWNNSNVTVTLNSADNETNGTGVKQITYSASGAQTIASTVVAASSASFMINTEGITTITFFGTDNAGNVEAANTLSIKLDKTPPSITCGAADGVWHATDVSIVCSASDVVSGLPNSSDASFSLSTNVPAGTETSNAATGTRPVCDVAGNCATAGPVTGNMVDKKPPSINVSSPASGGSYLLNQAVNTNYTCADGGSGVASCTGTVASGSAIDSASVGSKTFTANATDKVGNGAAPQTVSYSVIYGLCILYDTTRAVQSGSTIPLKIQLCDANNVDVSSSAIVVHAVSLVQVSTNASEVLQASGNANPDNDFRFDSTLGPTGGYIFNLSTKGLTTGSYLLTFTAGVDPNPHMLSFQVR